MKVLAQEPGVAMSKLLPDIRMNGPPRHPLLGCPRKLGSMVRINGL